MSKSQARVVGPRKRLLDSASKIASVPEALNPSYVPESEASVTRTAREQWIVTAIGDENSPYVINSLPSSEGYWNLASLCVYVRFRAEIDGRPLKKTEYAANSIGNSEPVVLYPKIAVTENLLESLWQQIQISHNSIILTNENYFDRKAHMYRMLFNSKVDKNTVLESQGWFEMTDEDALNLNSTTSTHFERKAKFLFSSEPRELYGQLGVDMSKSPKYWPSSLALTLIMRRQKSSFLLHCEEGLDAEVLKRIKIRISELTVSCLKVHPVSSLSVALSNRTLRTGLFYNFMSMNVGQVYVTKGSLSVPPVSVSAANGRLPRALLVCFTPASANDDNAFGTPKFEYRHFNVESFCLAIGSETYPLRPFQFRFGPVDYFLEAFRELYDISDVEHGLTATKFQSSHFVLGVSFVNGPIESDHLEMISAGDCYLQINFAKAVDSMICWTFTLQSACVKLDESNTISMIT